MGFEVIMKTRYRIIEEAASFKASLVGTELGKAYELMFGFITNLVSLEIQKLEDRIEHLEKLLIKAPPEGLFEKLIKTQEEIRDELIKLNSCKHQRSFREEAEDGHYFYNKCVDCGIILNPITDKPLNRNNLFTNK